MIALIIFIVAGSLDGISVIEIQLMQRLWEIVRPFGVDMSASDVIAENLVESGPQGTEGEKKKRASGGNIATLRFTNPSSNPPMTLMTLVRHKEIEVEPLLDLESGIQKVGPNGKPVISRREDHYYEELNKEILKEEIRYVQMIDGKQETVAKLSMTNTIDITEGRPLEECTIVDESEEVHKSLGTTIPIEDVSRYAPEAIHAAWPKDDTQAWSLYKLAEYLEKNRIALFFPYTHGNGFRIHSTTVYPIRFDGQLYLVWSNNKGEMLFKYPLRANEAMETAPERKVAMLATPRLRPAKKTSKGQ